VASGSAVGYSTGEGVFIVEEGRSRAVAGVSPPITGAWSPTGNVGVFGEQPGTDGALVVFGLLDGTHRNIGVSNPWQSSSPLVSPSGELVAFVDEGEPSVWVARTGDPREVWRVATLGAGDAPAVGQLSWSPDSTSLVYVVRGGIEVVDAARREQAPARRIDLDGVSVVLGISWGPRDLAVAGRRDGSWGVFVVAPDGAGLRELTRRSGRTLSSPQWSPDGSQLAWYGTEAESGTGVVAVCLLQVSSGALRQVVGAAANPRSPPRWSVEGNRVLAEMRDGNTVPPSPLRRLAWIGADGSQLGTVATAPVFSSTGTWPTAGRSTTKTPTTEVRP